MWLYENNFDFVKCNEDSSKFHFLNALKKLIRKNCQYGKRVSTLSCYNIDKKLFKCVPIINISTFKTFFKPKHPLFTGAMSK